MEEGSILLIHDFAVVVGKGILYGSILGGRADSRWLTWQSEHALMCKDMVHHMGKPVGEKLSKWWNSTMVSLLPHYLSFSYSLPRGKKKKMTAKRAMESFRH